MPLKRASQKAKPRDVFGQSRKSPKMLRAGLYARVSTSHQQTLAMQNRAMREYAARRGWTTVLQVREVNSGAVRREAREKVLEAARRREIDVVLVWRLDRLGPVGNRSAGDPSGTGASGCRFRIADRSSGSDHPSRSRHGRTAGDLFRVRKGSPAGTNTCGPGTCARKR